MRIATRTYEADRDPNLGPDGVVGSAVEGLDAQVLLDPLEEELDVPAAAVQLRHLPSTQAEVVGQQGDRLARLWIAGPHAPQGFRVALRGAGGHQNHGLVAQQPRRAIDFPGVAPLEAQVLLGPNDEAGLGEREVVEAGACQGE